MQTLNTAWIPVHLRPPSPGAGIRLPAAALLAAGALLAMDPAIWLVRSWSEPAYDSSGHIVFALIAGIFIWSASSPLVGQQTGRTRGWALGLLAVSALVRLASQILAINTLGALCLVVDVFAIGILLRLKDRERPVSPFWLAAAFMFCLPVERILQRTVGYGLQQLSADGACALLKTVFDDVTCEGIRILLNGADVLVDLPCSGARTLVLSLLGYTLAAALARPSLRAAVIGAATTLAAAAAANTIRISVLAIGISHPGAFGSINVMRQPWHDLIGLAALSLVCTALVFWVRASWHPGPAPAHAPSSPPANEGAWACHFVVSRHALPASLVAVALAVLIVSLPRTAVDVARAEAPFILPATLEGHARRADSLSERERAFFTQFGGTAAKASYGPHGLMLVRTSSPLRHLHAPDECLRGQGFEVEYVGASFGTLPTAIYAATGPDGARYRIDVSFISDRREVTTNIATAVWRWLQGDARHWTAIQRISPEGIPAADHARFTRAVIAALDLPTQTTGGPS
ncbi:MAG: exosortase T [Pseudomonadota bacterium]